MNANERTATALLTALRRIREHGGGAAALARAGVALQDTLRLMELSEELTEVIGQPATSDSANEALAVGFLAGRVARHPRPRHPQDPTSFVMDQNLLVRAAEGESILRLPWFEENLFVDRQLPDCREIPARIRQVAIESYRAALGGERTQYSFWSYGHGYTVDALPLRRNDGRVTAVLAVATPAARPSSVVRGPGETASAPAEPDTLTAREIEVLSLASQGLTHIETAERLVVAPSTVKTHLANVYEKLGVASKAAAVAAGLRHGLIE
jgi:DNA-binding CsgD family transcriptional regulator